MEQLTANQEIVWKYIRQLISSFNKARARVPERLQRLESSWRAFEEADIAIKQLAEVESQHKYFTSGYHNSIAMLYQAYREILIQQQLSPLEEAEEPTMKRS